MDLLQEYKELYYKELEHSERLNNKINTCITFLTILGSAQVLLWTKFKNFEFKLYSLIYLLVCVISLVFFILCLFRFYKTFSGYKYNYFPIKRMALATIETYELAGKNKKNIKRAEKHIYNMYSERFLNDAIINRKSNEEKNNKHRKLTQLISISFIVTILAFSFSVVIDYYENINYKDIYYIEIHGGEDNVK